MTAMAHPTERTWSAAGPIFTGIVALLLLFGGIGAWAFQAQISGAVVAGGRLATALSPQVVQSPEGGVVAEVLVGEGDIVGEGDLLLRMDRTALLADLETVRRQLDDLQARRLRLGAERDDEDRIPLPPDTAALASTRPHLADSLAAETALFIARQSTLRGDIAVIQERSAQGEARTEGIQAQLGALEAQRLLIEAELEDQQSLLDKQLAARSRVTSLQAELAAITGRIGELEGEAKLLGSQIFENGLAVERLKSQRRLEALDELRDLEFAGLELSRREDNLVDLIARTEVRAIFAGEVVGVRSIKTGAVVGAGQPLFSLVPTEGPLFVAASVEARDIGAVHIGQEVELHLTSERRTDQTRILGRITHVAADSVADSATGQSRYAIDITPDPDAVAAFGSRVRAGMPVGAFIKTNERRAITYLLEPFLAFFDLALRE